MHDKVRAAIAAKGLDRSHIIVLDALLKTAPGLLRSRGCSSCRPARRQGEVRQARTARWSMLPEMMAEGRRMLLFSQFTPCST